MVVEVVGGGYAGGVHVITAVSPVVAVLYAAQDVTTVSVGVVPTGVVPVLKLAGGIGAHPVVPVAAVCAS